MSSYPKAPVTWSTQAHSFQVSISLLHHWTALLYSIHCSFSTPSIAAGWFVLIFSLECMNWIYHFNKGKYLRASYHVFIFNFCSLIYEDDLEITQYWNKELANVLQECSYFMSTKNNYWLAHHWSNWFSFSNQK